MRIDLFKYTVKYIGVVCIGIIAYWSFSNYAIAADFHRFSDSWKLSQGGKIYDNWALALQVASPAETHPAYPANGKKTGSVTWRCKECHGWDYKGRDGDYSSGSHYTGIKGISDFSGKSLTAIKLIVRNKTHGYTKAMISDQALDLLALFVKRGQIDLTPYINYNTKRVKGDAKRGASFYETICAVCHGFDGRKMNFHQTEKRAEYVGTVAKSNPWEIIHKIRNGQPGSTMISLRALAVQDLIDIVVYTQLLPSK